jgi:hypothetical protein
MKLALANCLNDVNDTKAEFCKYKWDFVFLLAACMEMTFLWDAAPCSLVEIDHQHFRGSGSRFDLCLACSYIFTRSLLISLMMEAVSVSETSVPSYATSQKIVIFIFSKSNLPFVFSSCISFWIFTFNFASSSLAFWRSSVLYASVYFRCSSRTSATSLSLRNFFLASSISLATWGRLKHQLLLQPNWRFKYLSAVCVGRGFTDSLRICHLCLRGPRVQ